MTGIREKIAGRPWLVFWAILALFSLGTVGLEIVRLDVRFALMVDDLRIHGLGLFPTMRGMPYGDYPSGFMLPAWLTTLGGRYVTLWTLTLPGLILGAGIVTLVMRIGENAAPGAGIAAAGMMMLTPELLNIFMSFGLDVPVAAAGVLLLYLWQRKIAPWLAISSFIVLLVFCFACRGPMGFLLLGAAVGGFLLAERRWKAVLIAGTIGLATLLATGWLWRLLVCRQGGETLWQTFLDCQIGDRMAGGDYFYYFYSAAGSFAPTGIAALAAIILLRRKLWDSPAAGWLGFALLPILLLSIPGAKHLRYMLIALPALALLGGYGLVTGKWPERVLKPAVAILQWLGRCAWLLPIPAAAALIAIGLCLVGWQNLPWLQWLTMPVGGGVMAWFLSRMESGIFRDFLRTAVMGAIFLVLGLYPLANLQEYSAPFVRQVEAVARGPVAFYWMGPDQDDLKYLLHVTPVRRLQIDYIRDEPPRADTRYRRDYRYQWSAEALRQPQADAVWILQDRKFKHLETLAAGFGWKPVTVARGELGHRTCVAVRFIPYLNVSLNREK